MKTIARATLIALAVLVLLPAAASAQTTGAESLVGPHSRTVVNDGWTISFSQTWFSAEKGGRTITMGDFMYADSMDCQEWSETGRVMSIVGTIVTFEWSMYAYCGGAHGWADTKYISIDLGKGGQEVTPVDVFGKTVVEKALERDPVWQKAQKKGGLYECVLVDKKNTLGGRLAFHHVDGRRVAVRIGVGEYLSEACRGELVQLGLYLPVSNKLARDLAKAQEDKTLMNEMFEAGEEC